MEEFIPIPFHLYAYWFRYRICFSNVDTSFRMVMGSWMFVDSKQQNYTSWCHFNHYNCFILYCNTASERYLNVMVGIFYENISVN